MSTQTSWMISFGLAPVPSSFCNIKPSYIKRDTPETRKILNPKSKEAKEKRIKLIGYIDIALNEKIMLCKDIMIFLQQKELELCEDIGLRLKNGDLLADRTLASIVMHRKKELRIVEILVKDQIIDMYRNKFSYAEIIESISCSERYVIESLESIGVRVTKQEKKKVRYKTK